MEKQIAVDESENQIQDQTTRIEKDFSKYEEAGVDV
jgi:hypothetical protein